MKSMYSILAIFCFKMGVYGDEVSKVSACLRIAQTLEVAFIFTRWLYVDMLQTVKDTCGLVNQKLKLWTKPFYGLVHYVARPHANAAYLHSFPEDLGSDFIVYLWLVLFANNAVIMECLERSVLFDSTQPLSRLFPLNGLVEQKCFG